MDRKISVTRGKRNTNCCTARKPGVSDPMQCARSFGKTSLERHLLNEPHHVANLRGRLRQQAR
eukprot:280112-Pelagomonas_calceolata.AAC.2